MHRSISARRGWAIACTPCPVSSAARKKQPDLTHQGRTKMAFRSKAGRWNGLAAALAAAALLGLSLTPAYAQQSDPMDDLLEKLKNKGVLSEDEYQALKKAREEEQIELRNERRRQAQKAAQDAAKEETKAGEGGGRQEDQVRRQPGDQEHPAVRRCAAALREPGGHLHFSDPRHQRRRRRRPSTAGATPCASASAATSWRTGSTVCGWTPAPTPARPG